MTDMSAIYRQRRQKVAEALKERGIAAARFEDFEYLRSPTVRYLCGHPSDAFLVVTNEGACALIPWDVNMAAKMASVDMVLPYTEYGRKPETALRAALEKLAVPAGSQIEVSAATPYPSFVDLVAAFDEYDFVCDKKGIGAFVLDMRAIKDRGELAIYERASALTDRIIDLVERGVRSGELCTELAVAQFIEREARSAGAEGTGFETIAAGPDRSFGIHAFPSYGSGPFGTAGLSILDFGIVVDGYTSDVTMSFAKTPLTDTQEKMIALVEKAHKIGIAACGPGVPARKVAQAVDEFFASEGFVMPHALGHGVGLEAHEAPGINLREENEAVLNPGAIITIEPGLYDPELGGVRLEDDVLITETGYKVLTKSRIIRL